MPLRRLTIWTSPIEVLIYPRELERDAVQSGCPPHLSFGPKLTVGVQTSRGLSIVRSLRG